MTADASIALHAAGLGRRFGDRWAVRGISLDVRRGEVLGLLGPNGAGKTTTVRLLTALIEPSEGTAAIDGFDVRERPEDVMALARHFARPGLRFDADAEALLRAAKWPGFGSFSTSWSTTIWKPRCGR